MDVLKERLIKTLNLTKDFFNHISEEDLKLKISDVPSNTIGEQAYCIVGARESYLEALKIGEWAGFKCSLLESHNKPLIVSKLEETQSDIERFLQESSSEINMNLVMDLLEHEVQHHGQLIRYAYANKFAFPKSWNVRYTV
ncbi:hypothetical protein CR194_04370 [Salipaludibacillus keqinensis]|uniref:Damage-inducible protein DinB n=1 Tax=Salipaludibacillus keqinensis TaxID=2045207 RepID=A0A323TJM6_9BACI|nr:hypothetical protein [Salipaludibacillus keqinensis]PYZ94770.1 hypothetical protein CR194_04370 [Salipaludibacillus keqinensis]